jgi:hypothetical protein
LELTVPAVTANVTEAAPAGTVTVPGTEAAVDPEESVTTAPPVGAAPDNTTLPVTLPPLTTEFGDRMTLSTVGVGCVDGVTVRLALEEVPPYEAVIIAVWLEVTLPDATVNVAEVAPKGTATVAGTDAAFELEVSETGGPP